ncbi:TPA: hypothetical protein OUJ52_002431 [Morganella morganii]|nr:hypothetical protein [Morganella morganii]HCT5325261.1 hypothetical protein [Morganella morganii]HCU1241134.1 hypothetical protein [Morganella morganii]
MIKRLLIVATVFALSACTISNDPHWGKPKKPEYPAYIPTDGTYACVYDVETETGQSLLINNVRTKKPPLAVLGVKKISDSKIAAKLQLDTGAEFEGYNLVRLVPEKGSTTYQQSPSPKDMANSYYFLGVIYATDENMDVIGLSAFYQDVSSPVGISAHCVEPSKFKEMIQKPNYGMYQY